MTSLVFIQNFGDCSFICNYWTVYCLRIIYHLFASFVAVPLKYEKIMASKPFTFYLRMHISFTVIQIFTEKYFSSNFWIADPLYMVYVYLFIFLRCQQKYHMMFESNNIIDLQWGVLRPNWRSGSKIKAGASLQPTQILSPLWKTLGGSRERVTKG